MQFLCLLVDKQGNRHSPGTLTGDTPVRTAFEHQFDPCLAPVGYPFSPFDRLQRGAQQIFFCHADEPLRCRPVDKRCFCPPAVRIAVMNGLLRDKRLHLLQNTDDLFIYLVDVITGKLPCPCGENTVLIEQIEGADPVFQPDVEIVEAMIGCRVHRSSTGVGCDVFTQDQGYLTVFDKRVLKTLVLQAASTGFCDRFVLINAITQHDVIHHICS